MRSNWPVAGFWRRYAAYSVDSLLAGPLMGVVLAPYDDWSAGLMERAVHSAKDPLTTATFLQLADILAGAFLAQVVMALPAALFLASRWRATPGKKLFALCVVDADLKRLGFRRALARELGKIPAVFALGLGVLAIAIRKDKRAWYDRWCGTVVMKRWPLETLLRHSQSPQMPDMLDM